MKGDVLDIQFMARREAWDWGVSLYSRVKIEGIKQSFAKPLEYEDVDSTMHAEPFMRISIQAAQQLMDELWQCGLRPSEGTGSAGSLKATENHLKDMQKIVFKQLKIE